MEITEFFQVIRTPATVLHVIAVIFGMGGALVSDILFSFFAKDKELNPTEISTLSMLSKIVLYSLVVIVFSGAILFLSDMEGYMQSSKFLAKMSILFVLLLNGYLLNKYIWPHLLNKDFFTTDSERNTRRLAFACGAVSVISWLSICTLGVLDRLPISYGVIISIYFAVILFGVMVALFVEKRELN
jgi:uncharacterized membrane protein YsdA (DUF1294 family)